MEKAEYTTFHEAVAAICQYADEIQADLIVIGSHGYQGLAKFLMGSVSERVFKEANQPVIIVRNDKSHSIEISHFDEADPLKAMEPRLQINSYLKGEHIDVNNETFSRFSGTNGPDLP